MKNLLISFLKYFLGKKIYGALKNFYYLIERIKIQNYDLSRDLKYNEKLLKIFKTNKNEIKTILVSAGYQYDDKNLSWHYHLFAGLKNYFNNKNIKILEIGTHKGEFAKFISAVYKKSHITTIDLDENDKIFTHTYNRENKVHLKKFIDSRKKNIKSKNIKFIKLNSIFIKKYFLKERFDLIWIDGDHINPQVTIDIINSIDLIKSNGLICIDDVVMNSKHKTNDYVSNDSFATLNLLEKNKIIKNIFLIKRIRKENLFKKKYISISYFPNNEKLKIKNKILKFKKDFLE